MILQKKSNAHSWIAGVGILLAAAGCLFALPLVRKRAGLLFRRLFDAPPAKTTALQVNEMISEGGLAGISPASKKALPNGVKVKA